MPFWSSTSRAPWKRALLFGLAYLASAELSWNLASRNGTDVNLWLPTGFFVAGLLMAETRDWLSLLMAGALANIAFDAFHGSTFGLTLTYGVSNSAQALAGAYLTRRFVARFPRLTSVKEFLSVVLYAAIVPAALTAPIGAAIFLSVNSHVSPLRAALLVWSGNAMGALVVAPLVLIWFSPSDPALRWWRQPYRLLEASLLVAGLCFSCLYMLAEGGGIAVPTKSLLIPFILWAALRFGPRGATAINLLLALLMVYGASHFTVGLSLEQILSGAYVPTLYGFLTISVLAGLIPAIAVEERDLLVQELYHSEERFRNLAAAAKEGVVISEDGKVLDVNDQVLSLLGYGREELIGRSISDFVSPETRSIVAEDAAAGREATREHKLIRKDGGFFYAESNAKVARLGGRRIRMTAIRDISERKQAEALVSGQFNMLEMIAFGRPLPDIVNEIIAFVESQTNGVMGSVHLSEDGFLRLAAAPSLPRTLASVVERIPIGEGQGACGAAALGRLPVFVEDIAADPVMAPFVGAAQAHGLRACWSTPILDAKQQLLGTFALYSRQAGPPTPKQRTLIDVATHTASVAISRHRSEAALKLSDFSVHHASTPTYWVAQDSRIIRVNRAACEVLGYTEAELLAMTVPEMDPGFPAEKWEEHWRTARERKRMHFETRQRRKDGGVLLSEIDLNWFEFEGREYHFVFLHDVTERVQLEERLRQSQKMEAIGQLSGGIAHDFNNLLTVIQGNLGMIELSGAIPEGIGESLREIGHAVGRATNLTGQLLAFGRKQVMQSQEVDLNEVVKGFSQMLSRVIGETVEVKLALAPGALPVRADRSMLEQVMLNLSLNARDAMPRGGQLTLRTAAAVIGKEEMERMPAARAGSFALLMVADTGTGITPENLKRVFEPFFTTKEVGKGTGLGLASVYGILEQHKGWASVQSQVGLGTTFSIYLPLQEKAPEVKGTVSHPAEVPRGNETILLVEDDPAVRLIANKALVSMGYRVLVASNGNEARHLWERNRPQIRLLLTDMVMPGGLGGAEIARSFKAQKPSLRVILMSGYSADLAGTDFVSTGGDCFLGKPFEIAELASALRRCLMMPP